MARNFKWKKSNHEGWTYSEDLIINDKPRFIIGNKEGIITYSTVKDLDKNIEYNCDKREQCRELAISMAKKIIWI